MSTYAIGDIQGCYAPLQKLLEKIQFNSKQDILWFTGDIVNRGPESLATLRFVKQLGKQQYTVLGNHDLHLLALVIGAQPEKKENTLNEILFAPDRDELIDWLLHRPLLHHDANLDFTMVHAGLAPNWDLTTAMKLAKEVEFILQGPYAKDFFLNMYGNQPDYWDPELKGWERARCITNFFTRLRFCHKDGRMDLETKGKIETAPANLIPWFQLPNRANANLRIIFGHWAALEGKVNSPNLFALDTGCVWGNCLTALRLEDQTLFSVQC